MTLQLHVSPTDGPLWLRRNIHISGATPGGLVTLTANTDRNGVAWDSRVVLLADQNGNIDLARDTPVSGDFRVADPMGMFWAQRRAQDGGPQPEPADPSKPIVTHLTAETDYGNATATVTQWLMAEGVTRQEVRESDLIGTVFIPSGPGPHPTVLVFNGSGGGINEARAALYASRGIQAFAVGYFRGPGLPEFISRTPLEQFQRALDFTRDKLRPRGGRPLVSGQSRGGELTLQLASMFPDRIAGIIPFVPLHLRSSAQGAADPREGWDGPTWTWKGEPLAHLFDANDAVTWQPWSGGPPPSRHSDVYVAAVGNPGRVAASRIPIERFSGPIATVSGQDDRAWPSSWASRAVMMTLEQHGHTAERLMLDYEDAGHAITIPYMPATEIERIHPVSHVVYSNGGTSRGNAHASADSFERVCDFIHRTVSNLTEEGSDMTTEQLTGQWREWRHQHLATLSRPYGWTSLIAQYWLREGDEGVEFELLPGTWSVRDGRILYTPGNADRLSVNGAYPTDTVEIPPGRNQTYGHFDSVPVYHGDNEVETIARTTNSGEPLYGVRVRDPHTAIPAHELGLTAFEYDPAWRIPATFTPEERVDIEQETVEEGVRETTPRIGTLTFEHAGETYTLSVIGKPTARGIQPVAHIRDLTSGPVTYGAGRVIELEFSDGATDGRGRIDFIDFNYAHALPCAVTNFVTCPVPPRENHLDFEVLAGEKKPNDDIERVRTFNV